MSFKSCKWIFLSAALCSSSVFAATLQTSGGVLTGAIGVNVNGTFYDVTFVDGTCNSVFAGCVNSAFTFHTNADAYAAANALFSQVLLGAYDDRTANTYGCGNGGVCSILTPYIHTVPNDALTAAAWNSPNEVSDLVLTSSITPTLQTLSNAVFAVWSPSIVPVPATAWLFGSALIGLTGAARRKR